MDMPLLPMGHGVSPGVSIRLCHPEESVEDLDLRCCELLQLLKDLPQQQLAVVSHTGGAGEELLLVVLLIPGFLGSFWAMRNQMWEISHGHGEG